MNYHKRFIINGELITANIFPCEKMHFSECMFITITQQFDFSSDIEYAVIFNPEEKNYYWFNMLARFELKHIDYTKYTPKHLYNLLVIEELEEQYNDFD